MGRASIYSCLNVRADANTVKGIVGISNPNDCLWVIFSNLDRLNAAIKGPLFHLMDVAKKIGRSEEVAAINTYVDKRKIIESTVAAWLTNHSPGPV
jgi:hypothetical protein